MKIIEILKQRLKYQKSLETNLMNWKYFFFNFRTSNYFLRQQQNRDKEFLQQISKNLYKKQINMEQAQEAQKSIISFLQQKIKLYWNKEQFQKFELNKQNFEKIQNESEKQKVKFLEFVQIYNQCLESIIEGQREVLTNDQFKFDDGLTAKEKEEKFKQLMKGKLFFKQLSNLTPFNKF